MMNKQKLLLLALSMVGSTMLCAQSETNLSGDYINQQPALNLTGALKDRVTGLNFDRNNLLTIRGVRSLQEPNAATIMLNGLPFYGSLSDIDPAEIVSVQILKDAATAAMYGSEGINGVIMINTRQGRSPRPGKLSYQGYVASKKIFKRYPLMNAQQLKDYRRFWNRSYHYTESYEEIPGVISENKYTDIDRQDIFETALEYKHLLTLPVSWQSGYLHSGVGLSKNESILPNDYSKNWNVHFDLSQNLGQYVTLNFLGRYAHQDSRDNRGDIRQYLFQSPMTSERTALDTTMLFAYDKYDYDRYYADLSARFECPWIEGLSANLGVMRYGQFADHSLDFTYVINRGYASYYSDFPLQNRDRSTLAHADLSYEKSWESGHHITLSGLYSTERSVAHFIHNFYYSSTTDSGSSSYDPYCDKSQINSHRYTQRYTFGYDYKGRYEVKWSSQTERSYYIYSEEEMVRKSWRPSGTGDSEGFETNYHHYSSENRNIWAGSHALHLQWNLQNEPFAQSWEWLDRLSLRADQGLIKRPYDLGELVMTDKKLGEKYRSKNLGLDFSLWGGRLSGAFDLYKQQNSHLLCTERKSSYLSQVVQPARIENRGFELSLQGVVIDHWHDLTWQLGAGIFANHNKLTSADYSSFSGYDGLVGKSVHTIVTPMDSERNLGEPRYYYDSEEPKLKGHFSSVLSWRCWDLTVIGSFQIGGYFYSDCATYVPDGIITNRLNTKYQFIDHSKDNWKPCYEGDLAHVCRYDATVGRIRDITLGCNLTEKWSREKLPFCPSEVRLYVTVRNPFVFCSDFYSDFGLDPEPNSVYTPRYTPDQNHNINMVTFGVPTTRDILFGLNVTF